MREGDLRARIWNHEIHKIHERKFLCFVAEEKREAGGACEAFEGGKVFFAGRLIEVPDEVDVAAGAGAGDMAEFELLENSGEQGLCALRGIYDEATAAIPQGLEDEGVRNAIAIDAEYVDGEAEFAEGGHSFRQCSGVFREADKNVTTTGEVREFFCESATWLLWAIDDGGQSSKGISPSSGHWKRKGGTGIGVRTGEVIDNKNKNA